VAYAKSEWRARLLAARRATPETTRRGEALALAAAAGRVVTHGTADGTARRTVCCYVPVGTEPGGSLLLDAVAATGARVLLPVVAGRGPLDWATYAGPDSLVAGPHGLREPGGARLGPAAIATADLVFVPALAVDRAGVRLGRGRGFYDRSLPLARAGVPLIAVVRDEELVDTLPRQPHDVRMTGALTPGHGLVTL